MKIRLATNSDLSVLSEMNYQLIKDEGHSNPMAVPELLDRMKTWLQNEYTAAIIENGSTTIGYALWRIDDQYLYIRQFFIKSEHRRKHAGTIAIQLLKKEYWQGMLLRLEVLVSNQRGHSFWQSVGFEDYCITLEHKNT